MVIFVITGKEGFGETGAGDVFLVGEIDALEGTFETIETGFDIGEMEEEEGEKKVGSRDVKKGRMPGCCIICSFGKRGNAFEEEVK